MCWGEGEGEIASTDGGARVRTCACSMRARVCVPQGFDHRHQLDFDAELSQLKQQGLLVPWWVVPLHPPEGNLGGISRPEHGGTHADPLCGDVITQVDFHQAARHQPQQPLPERA